MANNVIFLPINDTAEFNRGSTAAAPSTPGSFVATPSDGEIALTWNPVSNILRYHIYYSLTTGVDTEDTRIQVASTETSYTLTGLTNGVTYYFKIAAVGAGGESTLSSEVNATPSEFQDQKSLLFGGTDEYMECGSLGFTGTVTISFWYKFTDSTSPIVIADKNIYNQTGIGLYISGTQVQAYGSGGDFAAGTALNDSNWHHMVFVWSGTTHTIYRDGVDITTDSSVTAVTPGAVNFRIGRMGSNYTKAYVNDVFIWTKALTSGNVTTLYNGGVPNDPETLSFGNEAHYWQMGDGVGDSFPNIVDQVGSNDGTMTNMEAGDIASETP